MTLRDIQNVQEFYARRAEQPHRPSPFTANRLTDEKHSESLARHFLQFYGRKQPGQIDSAECRQILVDTYKAIGEDFSPTDQDCQDYMRLLETDGDGG